MNIRFLTFIIFSFAFIITSTNSFAQNPEELSLVKIIAEGSLDQIQQMIAGGADVNVQNELGWTPLYAAVMFGKKDVIDLLLNSGADINIKDNSGKTPLFVAVESGQSGIVDILLARRPNLDIVNNNGDNALSLARKVGLSTIAYNLEQNGATMPAQVAPKPTMPAQGTPNQGIPSGRIGMPGQGNNQGNPFSNMSMQRRGTGGNVINPDPDNNQMNTNMPIPELSGNSDMPSGQNINAFTTDNLDPNEIQARIKKYPGLLEAVADVAGGSKSSLNHWSKTEKDNRRSLISAIRKQYNDEVEFIQKTATEEKAKKTIEQADTLRASRKKTFIAINNEVKNDESQNRLTSTRTTTTSSRRSGGGYVGNTTRTTSRRGRNTTTQPTDITQEQENEYSPEVQSEIDTWLNSDITSLSGRRSLMESVNDTIVSEIKSLRQTAESEKAEKTVAAIDGLLLARQMGFDELSKEFQENQQEQEPGIQSVPEMPDNGGQDMMRGRGTRGGQDMMQGRGMRGR